MIRYFGLLFFARQSNTITSIDVIKTEEVLRVRVFALVFRHQIMVKNDLAPCDFSTTFHRSRLLIGNVIRSA